MGGLKANHLQFWRDDQCVFKNLSIELSPASCLQVVGANGSGKSTLLRCLAGFLEPDNGEILFDGKSIFDAVADYQKKLAYLGHHNGLHQQLTVIESLTCDFALVLSEAQRAEAIHRIGLENHQHKLVRQLSQGQSRKLAMTRLMSQSRSLWLLDEPFMNLDPVARQWVVDALATHQARGGMVVVTAHSPIEALLNSSDSQIFTIGDPS